VLAQVEIEGGSSATPSSTMFLVSATRGGQRGTRNMISGGLVALADRPAAWGQLRRDRSLVPTAVEEMLRWTARRQLHGRRRARRRAGRAGDPRGRPRAAALASASRDERQFGPTADRFDIGRDPNHHVAFGFGAHFCIGATLARIEARQLLVVLLDRFETVEPAGDVERSHSAVIAGVKRAPLVFR
jgi:cytochrome P450